MDEADRAWFYDPSHPWLGNPELLERWWAILDKTVSMDFDGVIHPYTDGWKGPVPVDEPPTPGVTAFLKRLSDDGYRVVVSSVRCESEEGLKGTRDYLEQYGLALYIDDVTCQKPAAIAYVDDRAVPFVGDWDATREGVDALAVARTHGAAQQ